MHFQNVVYRKPTAFTAGGSLGSGSCQWGSASGLLRAAGLGPSPGWVGKAAGTGLAWDGAARLVGPVVRQSWRRVLRPPWGRG